MSVSVSSFPNLVSTRPDVNTENNLANLLIFSPWSFPKKKKRKGLQHVTKTVQNVMVLSYRAVIWVKSLHRAQRILTDNTHPSHSMFTLLPSGERYRSIHCHITRLQSSFISLAVRLFPSPSFELNTLSLFFCFFSVMYHKGALQPSCRQMTINERLHLPLEGSLVTFLHV